MRACCQATFPRLRAGRESAGPAIGPAETGPAPKSARRQTDGGDADCRGREPGPVALSASEIASELRLSRVTARRYLENLAASGVVERAPRYGQPGRPEFEYRWRR